MWLSFPFVELGCVSEPRQGLLWWVLFLLLGTGGRQRCGSCGAHPASGHSTTLLQAVEFPDLRGEEGKEKSNNSYMLQDSSFCFGKESAERSQRARENEWGDFCAIFFFFLMLFQFGSSGCVCLDQGLFWKKGCRKFLWKRRSWITGKSARHTLWEMKSGDPQKRGEVIILLGKGRVFKYLVFIKKFPHSFFCGKQGFSQI